MNLLFRNHACICLRLNVKTLLTLSTCQILELKHRTVGARRKNTFFGVGGWTCLFFFHPHVTLYVFFSWIWGENHTASMTACVCLCVRTMCAALAGQCSVQFRREQRRPRPGQSQYSGNPRVFRSPGPYLMGLSKKKVALSRVFLSHCLPLTLLFPSFSHAPPPSPTQHPLKPLCEWMNSKCLLSNSARVPVCCTGFHRKQGEVLQSHQTLPHDFW